MKVAVLGVHDNGEIIQLHLAPSEELLDLWGRAHGGKLLPIPKESLHITLCGSPQVSGVLSAPPAYVELSGVREMVARVDKVSVFLRVSSPTQQELRDYVTQIEKATGVEGLLNLRRIFHVSLSNLTGAVRGSISKVEEHSAVPYDVADYRPKNFGLKPRAGGRSSQSTAG